MNIFLFISIAFLFTLVVGSLLEKIRVPWVFAGLLLGSILSIYNPFFSITSSDTFEFLAETGMYFLLFIVGFEVNLQELKNKGSFIVRSTFLIILFEGLVGSVLLHLVFDQSWLMSVIVALSFATVGEAILVPILDEFGIINTKLGQTIIGIGTVDDIIEIASLIAVVFLVGNKTGSSPLTILISLGILFLLTLGFTKFKKEGREFKFKSIQTLFLFVLFTLFVFVGIGKFAEAAPLAALLAGISLRTFVNKDRLELIERETRAVAYGLFAPLFFLWVGASLDFKYVVNYPLLVLLVVSVSKGSKLLASYITARKELGSKNSILLGIGLSVRFSTSIIIVKILLDNGLIGIELYSVIVASSIVFKFIVPLLFSNLIVRWGVVGEQS